MGWRPWKHVVAGETEPELFRRCACGRFLGADTYEHDECELCRDTGSESETKTPCTTGGKVRR